MKKYWNKILPHFLVLIGFLVVSIAFFNPVLSGKVIFQSDILQYNGMAKQQRDFIADTGTESYWIDNAFGGMPTYQVGANYPHNYIKKLDKLIRFLPRPSDYLFIYFIGIYLLFLVLKVDPKFAFIGALAFGFSTYLIIILGVGHNAKAHAIAYMPLVLSGILLCFRQKLFWGFIILSIGLGLELVANHFQMTYYLLLLCICIGLVYFVFAIRKKQLQLFGQQIGVMVLAAILALGLNFTNILATQEYAAFSTRGPGELTVQPDGSSKSKQDGLSYDYITEYSYGIVESLNLFIPNFMGGSSTSSLDKNSATYTTLLQLTGSVSTAKQYAENMPTYWGKQSFVAAPAYIGAGILFLFVMALFLVRYKLKYWIVAGSLLSLLLSWGDNFSALTQFFVDFVPLYNKFRAVSSIQVILELCVPILAIIGLQQFFSKKIDKITKQNALKWSAIGATVVCSTILIFSGSWFDFYHPIDQQFPEELAQALREDRKSMLISDTIRSLVLVVLISGFLWMFLKQKIKPTYALIGIGILIVSDLVLVDRRYVNEDDFVAQSTMNRPFQASQADQLILKDTSHYRVLDLSVNPFNSGRASYFHNSIGGYHAAKPKRIQNLYEFYLSQGNQEVFNMMNIKYFILNSEEEGLQVQENNQANGNAWFVDTVKTVETYNEEILSLGNIKTKEIAIMQTDVASSLKQLQFITSNASLRLKEHQPNLQVYEYDTANKQFAVFSEVYYPHGWVAKINGKTLPIHRVNYLLRGLEVPAGKGEITFEFVPKVVQTGSRVSLASSLILLGLFAFGIVKWRKNKSN